MWSIPALALTEVERGELERRVRAKTASQREAQRARIVLLAPDAVPNRRIAAEVAMSDEYVGLWRRRFAERRLEGLKDLKRSGRPRTYGHDERLRVVAAATAERPAFDSEWGHRLLADYLSGGNVHSPPTGVWAGNISTALTGRWSLPRARPALPERTEIRAPTRMWSMPIIDGRHRRLAGHVARHPPKRRLEASVQPPRTRRSKLRCWWVALKSPMITVGSLQSDAQVGVDATWEGASFVRSAISTS